jgi:hypothetical protein
MSKKKTYRKILIFILSVYAVVSIIGFISLLSKHEKQNDYYDEKMMDLKSTRDSLKNSLDAIREVVIADNEMFTGEYENALNAFDKLLSSKKYADLDKQLIQFRIDKINALKSQGDTLINDIKAYQFALTSMTDAINKVEKSRDSLVVEIDERENDYSKKTEALKTEIAEKNKQLNRKEKIQVISFKNPKGNTIHYLGEVKNNQANGGGVGVWNTGSIYKGEWQNNQRHGKGLFEWTDGHKYDGEFVNDIREGEGTYQWSSGEKYVGAWKDGKRNGFGKLYDKDNNLKYEGQWLNDKIVE